ncbi:MAG: CapA family protein [Patescibacteria group bacterium]|jgi:poly-gamma-glutamate synthesis protein (capsule biosynthesis protein)
MKLSSKNKAILIELVVALIIGFFILQGNIIEPTINISNTLQNDSTPINNNQSFIEPKENDSVITIMAVGDIMLSRDVNTKIQKYNDYNYPFLKTADLLKSADITFGNLESPITPGRKINTNEMVFRADPESVEGLKLAGFDLVTLTNNHTLNFGKEGLSDTFKYLNTAGIEYMGAGETVKDAYLPVIKEINGMIFAFLAYSYATEPLSAYDSEKPNPTLAAMDFDKMKQDVARASESADFVIVSMHDGYEYQFTPNQHQKDFAHAAIESGADLVVGHHPHVVQTMEQYQDGYILYSLGNFVFDQMWSQETREGIIAEITFSKKGISAFEFFPVVIEDYAQPRFADAEEAGVIIERLDFNYQAIGVDPVRENSLTGLTISKEHANLP